MKDTSKTSLRRGHNEGNIRQRTDGRWEVRLSAGIDYKTGKPRRTSTCCNTRQEAIAILQQQAHEVRTQGWRDPMSVTLGEWYEYWLDTYMKDTVKQSTYASYRSYLNKHFCVLGKILLKKLEPHTLQEFYNYKFREEGLSPKTLRNYHMALHKCLQQAVKEHLLVYNPCDHRVYASEKPSKLIYKFYSLARSCMQTQPATFPHTAPGAARDAPVWAHSRCIGVVLVQPNTTLNSPLSGDFCFTTTAFT